MFNFWSRENEGGRNKLPSGIHTEQLMSRCGLSLLKLVFTLALPLKDSALMLTWTPDSLVSSSWNMRDVAKILFRHFHRFWKSREMPVLLNTIAASKLLNSAFYTNNWGCLLMNYSENFFPMDFLLLSVRYICIHIWYNKTYVNFKKLFLYEGITQVFNYLIRPSKYASLASGKVLSNLPNSRSNI
jgi:hypothetical protein